MNSHPFEKLNFASADLSRSQSTVIIDGESAALRWKQENNGFYCKNKWGFWQMTVAEADGKIVISSSVKLAAPVKHLHFSQLRCRNIPFDHLLSSGLSMGGSNVVTADENIRTAFDCFYTLSLTSGRKTLLISHPLDMTHFAKVAVTVNRKKVSLDICAETDHFSGTDITFPDITLAVGNGIYLLQNYANNNIDEARTFTSPVCGWNTWDYYRWTITEDEVLKNAEFIARDPILSKHIKRIIIDDGWQYCYGEWHANSYFPSGMKFLAAQIKKMGFSPGLWVAPVCVEPHARIAQLDYDMLALSEGGQAALSFDCMRRKNFVLDPTVEKSRKFLYDLFDRLVGEGFEYFKLDFLAAVFSARRYHDRSVPRSQIARLLLQSIYNGVDRRAELMGCNYPYMAGNKFVSIARVGGDIHADWECIKSNVTSVAYRFWMNKKLWLNDPDFALCRGVATSDQNDSLQPLLVFCEPQMENKPLFEKTFSSATESELEVLLSIVMMAGGAVNLSDDLTKLNEAGLAMARKVVCAESGNTAIALDMFSSKYPAKWQQTLSHGGRALVINWFDEPQEFKIDFADIPEKALDFWKGKTITVPREIILAPHSCLLLQY